jgi:hypothetical protein
MWGWGCAVASPLAVAAQLYHGQTVGTWHLGSTRKTRFGGGTTGGKMGMEHSGGQIPRGSPSKPCVARAQLVLARPKGHGGWGCAWKPQTAREVDMKLTRENEARWGRGG